MGEIKFEEALRKLEKIVDALEAGDIALDDALKKYEEGVQLTRLCEKRLDLAKKKVELLSKQEDGSMKITPFEEGSAEEEPRRSGVVKKRAKA